MSTASKRFDRSAAGDPGALDSILQTYRRPVFRLAYAALLDADLAGRAMQLAFDAALKALRPGLSEADFERQLFQHTLRACQRVRRRAAWARRLRFASTSPHDIGTDDLPAPDHFARHRMDVWQAICALPEAQRVALTLRYDFEMPLEQIARIARTSPGGVHARLSAARQALFTALDSPPAADATSQPDGARHE